RRQLPPLAIPDRVAQGGPARPGLEGGEWPLRGRGPRARVASRSPARAARAATGSTSASARTAVCRWSTRARRRRRSPRAERPSSGHVARVLAAILAGAGVAALIAWALVHIVE